MQRSVAHPTGPGALSVNPRRPAATYNRDVKTYVVRCGQRLERDFMGNAETPEEAVLYAMARAGLDADTFVVYDHDLNRTEVPRPTPRAES